MDRAGALGLALRVAAVTSGVALALALALHCFWGVPAGVLAVLTASGGLAVGWRLPAVPRRRAGEREHAELA